MAAPLWGKKKDDKSATDDVDSKFSVPVDPKDLIPWLEKKREDGKSAIPELQMKLNLSYVLGQQHVVWDPRSRRLLPARQDISNPQTTMRVNINKIATKVEQMIARLQKSNLGPECRPVTGDDDDIGAAKAGTRILLSELNRLHWDAFMLDVAQWSATIGTSYVHVCWDPKAGDVVGQVDDADVNQGQVILDIAQDFEMSVDPNARTWSQAGWCVRTLYMTEEACWEKYGKVPKTSDTGTSLVDDVLNVSDSTRDQTRSKLIPVHQMWMLPSRARHKGLVVTWAGQTILENPVDFPYKHAKLPFIPFDLLPGLGTRQGRTWVTDLVPIQADYNDARSREAGLRRTIVPKLLSEAGSIDAHSITSKVEVIEYTPMTNPPAWAIPDSGWMSQYEASMNRADQEINERSGQNDIASSDKGTSSMPAAAILAMQEQDDTKLSLTTKLFSDAIGQVGWQILMLIKQYWKEDRLVRTWSEAGTLEVAQFSGASVAEQLDVHVDAESAMPRSKSARMQLGMDLIANGPPGTPGSPFETWADFMRFIDMPGTDFVTEGVSLDIKQANRENDDLLQGKVRQVHTWHNHPVHITQHENVRKGETYEKLERQADAGDVEATQAIAALDAHIETHTGVQAQKAAGAAAAAAGGVPGAPPMPGMAQMPPEMPPGAPEGVPDGMDAGTASLAGIGGPGEPGAVPGFSPDEQAQSMGM